MAKTTVTVLWFRQDLRLADNPALLHAVEVGAIVPIYILDDVNAGDHSMGAASRWWLHHSLAALNRSLKGKLQFFAGDPLTLIPELMATWGASSIYWNRCYEPWRIRRDKQLKQQLLAQGYGVQSFAASLLWEPWQVAKPDGTPYRVFTPYYRKGCRKQGDPRFPSPRPARIRFADVPVSGVALDRLQLLPAIAWDREFYNCWQPGEAGAMDKLQVFLTDNINRYRQGRDVPREQATSRLSPHLHFGELSPNQVWYAALGSSTGQGAQEHLESFLSELGWREFSYYLLYHFPSLPVDNFQEKFNHFPWGADRKLITAWQRGRTGIPMVDAGMRELWQTGYMHNRVRMVVGSFLVKNLGQHWHYGERWFWDCLLDADLASNSASWQWVAGSGADAAPYFRIFNPVTQGEKFDAEGEYVRRYCPELAQLPNKFLHQPWAAPAEVLEAAGVRLGHNYPYPLVELKHSRQQALDRYAVIKSIGQV